MPRKRKIGTGITRHTQIVYDGFDPREFAEAHARSAGYISPFQDFPGWLEQFDTRLAERAKRQSLPTRADILVVYDAERRSNWYAADRDEWRKIMQSKSHRESHHFKQPRAQHARFYLTATDSDPEVEASWGWQWGYQSVRWYFGTLMGLALDARRALQKEAWLELAGRCIELGMMQREFQLKYSSDKLVQDYQRASERQIKGVDRANRRKKEEAATWQARAMEIADCIPFESRKSASATADFVLSNWTVGKPPAKGTLRKYISSAWPHLKRGQL